MMLYASAVALQGLIVAHAAIVLYLEIVEYYIGGDIVFGTGLWGIIAYQLLFL